MMPKLYLFLLAAAAMFPVQAKNLLENSSFEVISNGKPVKWVANKPKNFPDVEFKLTENNVRSGKYSAMIESRNPGTKVNHFLAYIQNIDLSKLDPYPAGKEVMLSFDFNPDAPGTVIRAYVEGTVMGKSFNSIGPTRSRYVGWGTYQLRFKLPEIKPTRMYVVLQLMTTGSVCFDNVCLETNPPPMAATPAAEVLKTVKPPELDVRFSDLPFMNTFIPGKTPMEFGFFAPMKEVKFTEVRTEIICEKTKKVVWSKRYESYGNRVQGKIILPETLKNGVYRLKCKAQIRGTAQEESFLFRVASEETVKNYPVHFREDGIMLYHGKPYFPIMVCPPFNNDEAYLAYQQAGFNGLTAQTNASGSRSLAKSFYARAAKYNLSIVEWCNFADTAGRSEADLNDHVLRTMRNAKNLPNFLGWMNDEDAWRGISVAYSKKAYEAFYANSPGYINWVNQAPRGTVDYLRRYVRYSDVTGADVYPIPAKTKHSEKPRENIACLGDYADDFMEAGDFSKPVWMILQAWSWGGKKGSPDKPFPTYDELRFMFYNSISHGATGIAWFDNHHLDPMNPVMVHLGNINHEFHAIEKFILDGTKSNTCELTGKSEGIRILERSLNGERLLIITNENDKDAVVTFNNNAPVKFFDTLKKQNLGASAEVSFKMKKLSVLILTTEPVSWTYPKRYAPMLPDSKPISLRDAVAQKKSCRTVWRGNWIWNHIKVNEQGYSAPFMTKKFTVSGTPESAWLCVGADNEAVVYLNGKEVERIYGWGNVSPIDLKPYLKQGENVLKIKVVNYNSFGGVVFEGEIKTSSGIQTILSDASCVFSSGKTYVYGVPPLEPWKHIILIP